MKTLHFLYHHLDAILQGIAFFVVIAIACGADGIADLIISLF